MNGDADAFVVDVERAVVPLRREFRDDRNTPLEVARPEPDEVELRRVASVDFAREPVDEFWSQARAECLDPG